MSEVTLYAQADVLDVTLELRPVADAAELGRLILRAIESGVHDHTTIARFFGLTSRFTVDVLGDLWTAGWITIDLGTEREAVLLSDAGRRYLTGDDEAASTRLAVATSRVLLERLTGRVLGERASVRSVDRRMVIPVLPDDRTARGIRTTEYADAVRQNLERVDQDLGFMDNQRVASVRLLPRNRDLSLERVMVPVRVSIWRDGETLRVRLTDTDIPAHVRDQAATRLERYFRENPATAFTRSIRAQAAQLAERVRSIDDQLGELFRNTEDLTSAAPGTRQSSHDRLKALANELLDRAVSLADREMDVEVISTKAEHEQTIRSLITGAERQLIIAVPRITLPILSRYREGLDAAVARGVRVFLIWGLEFSTAALDERIRQELYEISRRGRGGGVVRFAAASANIHAKVVIADDRAALVTSKNFLSDSNFAEVGAMVRADEDRPAPVIEELLGWASRVMPDYELAQQILRSADEFGGRNAPPLVKRPRIPRYEDGLEDAPPGDSGLGLWAAHWRSAAQEVAAALVRSRPVVRPLSDGFHHSLVRELLTEARHRMVVSSHRIATPVISRDLASRAEGAGERGVMVELLYGELEKSTTEADVAGLTDQGSATRVEARVRPGNHSKVLLADDTVVIGSFNYLSFGGVSRRQMSSEVSLEVVSAAIADQVAGILGSRSTTIARAPRPQVDLTSSHTLERARELVVELTTGVADPASVVAALADVDTDALLEALAAANEYFSRDRVLSALVAEGVAEGRPRRLRSLMDVAADHADWSAAILFRDALADDVVDTLPDAALVACVAAPADDRALFAVLVPFGAVDNDAFCSFLAAELLIESRSDLSEILTDRLPTCGPAVAAVVRAILDHARDMGGLDRLALRTAQLRRTEEESRIAGWQRLDEAVIRLRDVDVRVIPGRVTIDHVFAPGSEYATVQEIAAERDPARLEKWFDSHEPDDAKWVDQSARAAGAPPIVAGLRERFATRRRSVRRAAREVILASAMSASDAREMQPGEGDSLAAIVELARRLPTTSATAYGAALARFARNRLLRLLDPDAQARRYDIWRFPRVPAAGSLSADERASVAALDLFEVRTVADAVRVLLLEDDLSPARELITQLAERDELGEEEVQRHERTIDIEHDRREQQTRARVDEILTRAQLLGTDAPTAELARRSGAAPTSQLDAQLAAEEERLTTFAAEEELALTRAAEQYRTDDPARFRRVRALVASGELAAATSALHSRPNRSAELVTPAPFLFLGWSMGDLWRNIRDDMERERGFDDLLPHDESDMRGHRVVRAILGLERREEDPGAVDEYLAAVQALIKPELESDGVGRTGALTHFILPAAAHLRWGYNAVPVAIDTTDAGGLFSMSTNLEAAAAEMPVISISDILPLLNVADADSRTEIRQRGFLRALASQLPVSEVLDTVTIGHDAAPLPDEALARLLHILNVEVSVLERSVLHTMFGQHPAVLWRIVQWVREHVNGPVHFRPLLARPEFDDAVVAAVVADVASAATVTVLGVLAEYGERAGATVEELDDVIRDLAAEIWEKTDDRAKIRRGALPDGLSIVDVRRELTKLIAQRYVTEMPAGRFCVRADAPWYSLRRDWGGSWFAAAMQRATSIALSDFHTRYEESLMLRLLHGWRGQAIEGIDRNERSIRLGLDDLRNWRIPANVANILRVVDGLVSAPADVYVGIGHNVDSRVHVRGPYIHLAVLLQDALNNAVEALRNADGDDRSVRLDARIELDETVLFRISDTGPGFTAQHLADWEAGRAVPSQHEDGVGRGLDSFREFDRNWGTVSLFNGKRGAVVEIRVPRVEDQDAATDGSDPLWSPPSS